jgi:predicted helicase
MANFKDIKAHLLSLDSDARGKLFERYCKWFLENDSSYALQLKQVWLWKDWPEKWGRDKGIDLIAETHQGKIWAIQVKAYNENNYITKEDIDTFLSESSREIISFRLLIATTNNLGPNAQEVMSGQEKPVGLCLLEQLETVEINWPHDLTKSQSLFKKEIRIPSPHQMEAIQNILLGFEKSAFGQVHMACGTGKTLVGLWVTEQLKSNTTLVLVPSIALISQLYKEWCNNCSNEFNFSPIFVCSDETVWKKEDDDDGHSQEILASLGFPVTTKLPDLIKELSFPGNKVIFATYHSSPIIKQACEQDNSLIFDLVIADEAHRCAGKAKSAFAPVADKDAIRSHRKLFMTATPKIFAEHVKKKSQEFEFAIASMDDEEKFGPVFHKLPFSAAIKQDLLTDYQVVISIVDNKTYQEYAERGRFVSINNYETDARTVASQLLIAKAIRQYDLKKIITFHNRKKSAQEFVNDFPKAINLLPECEKPNIEYLDVIFGEMLQSNRANILKKFRELNIGCSLLGNVKCLSEGVDVPALDGIAFIDPKGSEIDIVQAIGRVIRKAENNTKKIGTIIIPVFIDALSNETIALEESCFKPVAKVLRALRAHDDMLAEELDNIRLELGKRVYKKPPKLRKITIDLPIGIGVEFAEALNIKIIFEAMRTRCWLSFEGAREFVRNLGLKSESEWRLYIAGEMSYLPKLPDDIPKAPWVAYENAGWNSWGDFLGTNQIAPRFKKYRTYEEAIEFVYQK